MLRKIKRGFKDRIEEDSLKVKTEKTIIHTKMRFTKMFTFSHKLPFPNST